MAKGIIYIMTTAVDGLIKIGKTNTANFEQRMNYLEHNGYANVTALKRTFAIEVEDFDEKEKLLHTIFEKSQVAETELFATNVDIAIRLLASFEGRVVYPETETKKEVFEEAVAISAAKEIPDGKYKLKRLKKSDGKKEVNATAEVKNGSWTILKGSVIGIAEDKGVSLKAKEVRAGIKIDAQGKVLENYELGIVTPSFAGNVVLNASINGWVEWKDKNGQPVSIYREKNKDTD